MDLAAALVGPRLEVAKQILEPRSLLPPVSERPKKLKLPFIHVDGTYAELVMRCERVVLQSRVPESRVWKHSGKQLVNGAFAVRKSAREDRFISALVPTNQLIDPAKLLRPTFAYPPRLRTLKISKAKKVVIYKRDARNYFHRFAIGKRWRKLMCHPPLPPSFGPKRFPVRHTAPVGFGPSAGWAQEFTNLATEMAELPAERRVLITDTAPDTFPAWGSIIDGIWAAAEEYRRGQHPDLEAEKWMTGVDGALDSVGVEVHPEKIINRKGGEEFQGAVIHPDFHWLGASYQRRVEAMAATLGVLGQRRPLVKAVERLVGKVSYCQAFCPPSRSVFEGVYEWLVHQRAVNAARSELWPRVWAELFMAAMLLPVTCSELDVEWCERLECTDAAPGGHGRAWASVPVSTVRSIAQLADCKAPHTSLHKEFGLDLDHEYKCPIARVELPLLSHWSEAPRPGGYEHITLEEAGAMNWSLEARLKYPNGVGCRVLHGGDNAANVAAYIKGRSASRRLNRRCRRAAAIQIGGKLVGFSFG